MTRPDIDIHAFAERWSRLWGESYARMVEECYAPNVELVHAGWGEDGVIRGRDGLLATEERLKRLIPDHENPLVRVVDGDDKVVIESLITGTSPGDASRMACPAVVWWRLDENGLVAHETAYWEWSKRRPDDSTVQGTLRRGDGRRRDHRWYRQFADQLAHLWTTDPLAMVEQLYAADCVLERLGDGPEGIVTGREALAVAERRLLELLPMPQRRMQIREVSAADDVLAIAFTIEGSWRGTGPRRAGPGTLLLTLDDQDRITSDRTYWHWSRAREVTA